MIRFFNKGKAASIYAAITQGLHGVLLTLLMLIPTIAIKINGEFNIIIGSGDEGVYGIVIASFVELFMLVFSTFLLTYKKIVNSQSFIGIFGFIFSKKGLIIMISGVVGGALGTMLLTLGIVFAGESYGIALSVLFPIISAVLGNIFLKERIDRMGWILLVVAAGVALILSLFGQSANARNLVLGMVFGLLAGAFWAIEAVIISHSFKKYNLSISDAETLFIRQLGSAPFSMIISVPIISLIQSNNINDGYLMMGTLISNADSLFSIIGCSLNLFLSWYAFYNAIRHLGSTAATSINVTYIAWAPLLGLLIYSFTDINTDVPNWSYWVFSTILIACIASFNFREHKLNI